MARNKNQLYEIEIKSIAILNEGKRSLICYLQGGNRKTILMNIKHLFPQFTKEDDKPMVSITPISYREYQKRLETNVVEKKVHSIGGTI